MLRTRSAALTALGRPEEALTAIEESVAVYRELEAENPGTYVGALAGAQCDRADRLVALDRAMEALTVTDDALAVCREPTSLPRPAPQAVATALLLRKRSQLLAALGRGEEALADIEQAVTLYRTHANELPTGAELKAALGDQVDRLRAVGQHREADAVEWQIGRQDRPRRWWRR